MNKGMLPKLAGYRLRLRPIASSLDECGRELHREDDYWLVQGVDERRVLIENPRTGHRYDLMVDQIHNFNEEMSDGELQRGNLLLNVQLFLRGPRAWSERTRPGEDQPYLKETVDLSVDFDYPVREGISEACEKNGWNLGWARSSQLQLRLSEGAQIFAQELKPRVLTQYHVADPREPLILIVRRSQ